MSKMGGGLHEGLKTREPKGAPGSPAGDPSLKPIGKAHSTSVDSGACRSEVGQVKPATLGPRTA